MKYFITEKEKNIVVFVESEKIHTLCELADHIDDYRQGCVLEVTHNRKMQQGSIIIEKKDDEFIHTVEDLVNMYKMI